MKPFRFRLERLLELRRKQEEAAAMALSEARRETARRRRRVEELQAKLRETDAIRLDAQLKGDWPEVFGADRAGKRIQLDLEDANARVVESLEAEERARLEVVERMRAREIVDKLKEKAKESYDKEVSAVEQKTTDDITNSRYGREV